MLPLLPVRNRVFWLDPTLGPTACAHLRLQLEVLGGRVHDTIDLRLDYLVLDDLRRGWPGATAAEEQADAISGGSIAPIYLTDLHKILAATPGVGAYLRRGQDARTHWEAIVPLWAVAGELNLTDADLTHLDLAGFRFPYGNFRGASFQGTNLDRAEFRDPHRLDLTGVASCRGMTLNRADECRFDGLDLRDATLSGAFRHCSFARANLTGVNLVFWDTTHLTAEEMSAHRADLLGATLQGAKLRAAVLTEAGLDHADLSNADLTGANLAGASLREANLSGAILTGARLRQADLRGANLATAHLAGAHLVGADFDRTTQWPPDFQPDAAGLTRWPILVPRQTPYQYPSTEYGNFQGHLAHALGDADAEIVFALVEAGVGVLTSTVGGDWASGIVVEPGTSRHLYCCRIGGHGANVCGTEQLVLCGRRTRGLCPHAALLLLTLVQRGEVFITLAEEWLRWASSTTPQPDRAVLAAILASATLPDPPDYRPGEVLPEDYYAL